MSFTHGRGLAALTAAAAGLMLTATVAWAQPTVERSVKVAPGGLYEIVFNPADNDVYVAAVGPRGQTVAQIARLNGATLEARQSVDVSDHPLYGLALNSRTQTIYGADTRQGVISVVDLASGRIVANIGSDRPNAHVRQVLVDEDANKIYVSEVGARGADAGTSRIWVIDGATNTLERTIEANGVLTGLALDRAGHRVFSTDMAANEVFVIDLASGETVHRWPVGSEGAINVVYDAAGDRLFVTAQGTGDLTVMNAADGAIIHKTPTGAGALSVAYNPAVNQVYVANRQAGTVSVIDATSYEVLADLASGTFPQTIAIDPATNAVYVTNKARGLPRNAPEGTPVPVDPTGDVVTVIRP